MAKTSLQDRLYKQTQKKHQDECAAAERQEQAEVKKVAAEEKKKPKTLARLSKIFEGVSDRQIIKALNNDKKIEITLYRSLSGFSTDTAKETDGYKSLCEKLNSVNARIEHMSYTPMPLSMSTYVHETFVRGRISLSLGWDKDKFESAAKKDMQLDKL